MLTTAEMVLDKGIVPLSLVFRTAFPDVTYGATPAKQRLLQMPLVVIRIGEPHRGNSQLYIMEYVHGMNYVNLSQFWNFTYSTSKDQQRRDEDSTAHCPK